MTTQNSRIKYFIPKCHVSQAALSSNWGRTSVLPEGLHTTPPNFHVYDCCQNCCAYTENFFIKHYYTILWVFYEPIWSRPNILIFLRLLKTQISKQRETSWNSPTKVPFRCPGVTLHSPNCYCYFCGFYETPQQATSTKQILINLQPAHKLSEIQIYILDISGYFKQAD